TGGAGPSGSPPGPAQPAGERPEFLLDMVVPQTARLPQDLVPETFPAPRVPGPARRAAPPELRYPVGERPTRPGRRLPAVVDGAADVEQPTLVPFAEGVPQRLQLVRQREALVAPALGAVGQVGVAGHAQPVALEVLAEQVARLGRSQPEQHERGEQEQ